jgi:hypothetical protein
MKTIATLSVTGFVRAIVHKDLSVLDEEADTLLEAEELDKCRRDAWLQINSEWCLSVGDGDMSSYVNQTDRMQVLVLRIHAYTTVVNTLRYWHYERLAQALRDEFDVALGKDDKEQYQEDLDRVLIELKADEIELNQLEAMREAKEQEAAKPQSAPNEEMFDEILWQIFKVLFQKPALNISAIKDEMRVKELAIAIKDLKRSKPNPQPAAMPTV